MDLMLVEFLSCEVSLLLLMEEFEFDSFTIISGLLRQASCHSGRKILVSGEACTIYI
jgi:hypothetical protein